MKRRKSGRGPGVRVEVDELKEALSDAVREYDALVEDYKRLEEQIESLGGSQSQPSVR